MAKPKVSILCSTFNHGKFIEQALDSFLMQQTDFDFEVLINDDCSTDGTTEIIKRYQKKYPDVIKPIFQKENQFSLGKRNMIIRYLLPNAKGAYIALCEGDDYWTDPNKLQKQVDFMDKHPDYSVCFHPVEVVFEEGDKKDVIFPEATSGFTVQKLLKSNFIQTNSVMYKRAAYKNMATGVMPGDWYLHLYHAQFGKIGFINEVMSVYRRHPGGIWWDSQGDLSAFWAKNGVNHLVFYQELINMYGEKPGYRKIIVRNIVDGIFGIFKLSEKDQDIMLRELTERVPTIMPLVVKELHNLFETTVNTQNNEIERLKKLIEQQEYTLQDIRSSRLWKARNKLAKTIGKPTI